MQQIIAFLGRLFFSVIFIFSGIGKIFYWDKTEQMLVNQMLDLLSKSYDHAWAKALFDHILPLAPTLLVIATIVEIAGGLLILLGIQVRLGALMLVLYLIPVTFLFHNFWSLEGQEQQMQMINFLKNVAIFGGGLTLVAFGKGATKGKGKEKGK